MTTPTYFDVVAESSYLDLQDCVLQYQLSKSEYLLRIILYKLRPTLNFYLYTKTNYSDKAELIALYEDKLLECLGNYNPNRKGGKEASFLTYYCRCLDNALINFINSNKRELLSLDYLVYEGTTLLDSLGQENLNLDEYDVNVILAKLREFLDDNEYRVCEVILSESHLLRKVEIARELDLTISAIPNILNRLRKKFTPAKVAEIF